jgi:hypothetical protein
MARKAADGLAITSVNFALRSDVAHRWMASRDERVAYGAAPAAAIAAARAAEPEPAPAPAAAAPRPSPAPAAAPTPRADTPARVVITESKPYDRDAVIAAEISKMEELGDEMHREIQDKLRKK